MLSNKKRLIPHIDIPIYIAMKFWRHNVQIYNTVQTFYLKNQKAWERKDKRVILQSATPGLVLAPHVVP